MGVRKYATDDDKPYSWNARCLSRRAWRELKDAYENRCTYCGTRVRKLIPEHVIPLSRGGEDTPENIVPSCGGCNASKYDLFLLEWVMVEHGIFKRVSYAHRYEGYNIYTTRQAPRVFVSVVAPDAA